jgi:ankyrin repeat protein
MLLDAGADVAVLTPIGVTALEKAAELGYVEIATLLTAREAQVQYDVHKSAWPLYAAVADGHIACVRFLIEANADVYETSSDNEPLPFTAAKEGHVDGPGLATRVWCRHGNNQRQW